MAERILATRPATKDDFEYVWSVYSDAVKPHIVPHLKNGWQDAVEIENFRKMWSPSGSHIITVDGSHVGWAGVVVSDKQVEIEHLYIERSHRGKGYGTRLVSEMAKRWSEQGKAVSAPVLSDERLLKWVSRFGFQLSGETGGRLTRTFAYRPKEVGAGKDAEGGMLS